MSREAKRRERLRAIEDELRQRLDRELQQVANGENTLFFMTREFNPHDFPEGWLPATSEELSDLASEALRLRKILAEPPQESVAFAFRRALREASDLTNQHRLGPIRRAQELLLEIRKMSPPRTGDDAS